MEATTRENKMEENLQTIKTSRFGEVQIDKNLLFEFVSPIIGYSGHRYFVIIDWQPQSPFKWLQSVDDPELAFPITLCSYFNIDYQFELSDEDAQVIGVESAENILAINIVTIPNDNPQGSTVNLLAPIVINTANNHAMQVILKNTEYKVRHPLFEQDEQKTAVKAD